MNKKPKKKKNYFKISNFLSIFRRPLRLFLGLSVMLFTAMNLACAIVTKQHERDYASVPLFLLYIRVTITETMFLIYGILLSVCIFKMTKMASSQRVLEAKVSIYLEV